MRDGVSEKCKIEAINKNAILCSGGWAGGPKEAEPGYFGEASLNLGLLSLDFSSVYLTISNFANKISCICFTLKIYAI